MHNYLRRSSPAALAATAGAFMAAVLVSGGAGVMPAAHAQAGAVTMFVSVLDREGAPVPGLQADEFVIRENGVRREVLRVTQPATEPIDIALVVDNTTASSPYVMDIRKGVTAFIEALHATHFISLVTIADRPVIYVDYTHNLAQLRAGVGRLFPITGSGSYMMDAVIDLSRGFLKRKSERAAIVALSADGPEFSDISYQQALEALAAGGASLNVIVINPRAGATSNEATRGRMIVFDRGPQQSGGVRLDAISSMALPARFGLLATQLANQYRVVYSRPESLIPPDRFEVSVTRPGLQAHGTPARPRNP
jgi:VWFA-related protein